MSRCVGEGKAHAAHDVPRRLLNYWEVVTWRSCFCGPGMELGRLYVPDYNYAVYPSSHRSLE